MTSIGAQFRSLRDVVVDALREQIVEGELTPGQRLVERDLADALEVSRITLREALQQLASEGLVTVAPRRGAVVAPLTADDVVHVFEVRLALEGLAARAAADRRTDADLARLRELLDAARRANEADDQGEVARLNTEFHLEVVRASGNPLLLSIMSSLQGQVRRLFRVARRFDTTELHDAHEELYDALVRRDGERAAAVMTGHVEATRQPTLDVLADA